MPADLVSTVLAQLTPGLAERIATRLGLDRATVDRGLRALVPGILWLFARLAAQPDGARLVGSALASREVDLQRGGWPASDAAQRTEPGAPVPATPATAAGGAETDVLSSLLGSSQLGALVNAAERHLGLAEGEARRLLGMAGPVVLGGLAQAQRDSDLDGEGIARELAAQRRQIEAVMPAGFAESLRATEIAGGTAAAGEAMQPQTDARGPAVTTRPANAAARSPAPVWSYAALALVAILALIWAIQWGLRPTETAQAPGGTLPERVPQSAQPAIAVGLPVFSADGERLGEVSEVVLSADGSLQAIRSEIGTRLGIGERTVSIPADRLERRSDRVVLRMTAAEARELPAAPR